MGIPEIRLKKGRERSVYHRHPWLFSGAVKSKDSFEAGDIIQITEDSGTPIALAFGFPSSEIVARIFDFIPLSDPNENFWRLRIRQAYDFRQSWIDESKTNTYRLIHSEGDQLPGLIADVYDDTVSLQILHPGMATLMPVIKNTLIDLGFQHIYLKQKNSTRYAEGVELQDQWLHGGHTGPIEVFENGLRFQVDVVEGQKTGFFIDQRDNRALVQACSNGKRVLNAFSYTGGFSVYAAAGGASEVVSVDISKEAVAQCYHNMELNFPGFQHDGITMDCFEYLKNLENHRFDMIILDPPAFAKTAKAVSNASRGYKEINLAAFKKLPPGGLLFTFSCSRNIDRDLFRKIVFGAAADARRHVQILYQLTQPPDHPISIFHPEGEYLKGLVLRVF